MAVLLNETPDPTVETLADNMLRRKPSGLRQMLFRQAARHRGPLAFPFHLAHPVSGLGRHRRRRPQLLRLRPGRIVPRALQHPAAGATIRRSPSCSPSPPPSRSAIISLSYTGLIEHFPFSGGGYGVASKLLGPYFGLISGCALLVDYVLTITTSIASGVDQAFNVVPPALAWLEAAGGTGLIAALIVLNLRGIKESITIIVPIFLLFVFTHLALMAGIIILHPGSAAWATSRPCCTRRCIPTRTAWAFGSCW